MSADPCACGCCEPPVPAAPRAIFNVPGLPDVEYRIGTYATFRAALLAQLLTRRELTRLTTRDDSDYAIALLGSWAYIADILTFYSERTVNESFLRTARLRESIGLLAGMVGYDLSPGLAATASLAFALEDGAQFTLVEGARVQSVPEPGDDAPPVKFETLAALDGRGVLSRVPVSAPPVGITPLAAGRSKAQVAPGAALPAEATTGATLVAWSGASGAVERKQLDAVEPDGTLRWSPPLLQARTQLRPSLRTLRLFGYDAPERFLATAPPTATAPAKVVELVSGGSRMLGSEVVPYDFALAATTSIDLDAEYPDLRLGAQLLICSPSASATVNATVTALSRAHVRFGPAQATVTRVGLNVSTPNIADRRLVELHELGGDIPLWAFEQPAQINGAVVCAPLAAEDAPERGRAVVLADAAGTVAAARVVASAPAANLPAQLAITVAPAPPTLQAASAVLLGNVVRASHGEAVVGDLLGRGDAAVAFQRFPLAKRPLTRVPQPGAPHGGRSTLTLRVDGIEWHERERLYGAGPEDRVFVVDVDDDGAHHVRVGDGVHGARLATGAEVRAWYRKGLGLAGNVVAGALRSPLTRPKGLAGVTNPEPAGGGADPEPRDEARRNAPITVRTFDRIVSLADAEDQARANALVAKAGAVWTTVGVARGVALTVAGPGGANLSAAQLADLRADLDARRDPNLPFDVHAHKPLALSLRVRVIAADPDRLAEDVRASVSAALLERFSFAAREFGQPVRVSDVFVAAQSAAGVHGIDVEALTLADPAEAAAHLLGTGLVHERIDLAPHELATLAAGDLEVTGP